ncbi:hypothetical protein Q4485_03660 [Granulosicoccaceae sp. 1_MG-2023]|nr:hypothetical protein [Granulosicoccaceae sp. 1_MG-2023]
MNLSVDRKTMNDSDQSYKKSVIPLFLEVRPSPSFQALALLLHGAALFAVTRTSLGLEWQALIAALVLFSAYQSFKLSNRSYRLQWRKDQRWEVRYPCGDKRTGKMLPGTYFNSWLVVLNLRTGSTRKDLILIPKDAISPDEFTRLRARMKIEAKNAISG